MQASNPVQFKPGWSRRLCEDDIIRWTQLQGHKNYAATANQIEGRVRNLFQMASSTSLNPATKKIILPDPAEGASEDYRRIFRELYSNLSIYLNMAQNNGIRIAFAEIPGKSSCYQTELSWENAQILREFSERLERDSKIKEESYYS